LENANNSAVLTPRWHLPPIQHSRTSKKDAVSVNKWCDYFRAADNSEYERKSVCNLQCRIYPLGRMGTCPWASTRKKTSTTRQKDEKMYATESENFYFSTLKLVPTFFDLIYLLLFNVLPWYIITINAHIHYCTFYFMWVRASTTSVPMGLHRGKSGTGNL